MRNLLLSVAALSLACSSSNENKRAEVGAGAGAATGAVVGGATAGWKGAVVGGVIGGVAGGAAGHILDKQAAELKARAADTKRTADGILVRLKENLIFEVNSAQLKPGADATLGDLADVLKKYPEDRIEIRGYTDSTGPAQYNEALSLRRAEAVRHALSDAGVRDEQMKAIGMGPNSPIASNSTKDGRAKNRRVELKIALVEK